MAINKIVIGEGQDYERTVYLTKPKGRKAREIMATVLEFMNKLQKTQASGDADQNSLMGIITLLNVFWTGSEFEDVIAPFVLQLDNPEGRKYLDEQVSTGEMLNSFIKAAEYLIESSFGQAEVQEALGKSNDEAQEAPKNKKAALT